MKFIIIVIALMFISCKTGNYEIETSKEKEQWIFAYKSEAFSSCMKSSGVNINNDASPSLNFEVLGDIDIFAKADSIGKNHSKIIDEKSVWLQGGDLNGYKAVTNGCLEFYNSKHLDSLANFEYAKLKK